jgi:hypothetical protein
VKAKCATRLEWPAADAVDVSGNRALQKKRPVAISLVGPRGFVKSNSPESNEQTPDQLCALSLPGLFVNWFTK